MKKFNTDTIVSLVFIVVSLIWLTMSMSYPNTDSEIGSGFFPIVCSLVMFATACALLLQSIKKKSSFKFEYTKEDTFRVILVIAITLVYVILLPYVGYLISTIVLLVSIMLIFGLRHKILLLGVGICFPVLIYFVFQELLIVQLP